MNSIALRMLLGDRADAVLGVFVVLIVACVRGPRGIFTTSGHPEPMTSQKR